MNCEKICWSNVQHTVFTYVFGLDYPSRPWPGGPGHVRRRVFRSRGSHSSAPVTPYAPPSSSVPRATPYTRATSR